MKTCGRCKESKPVSEFGKSKSNKDGLSYTCSPCRKVQRKENRLSNKEMYDASKKRYRETHLDLYSKWQYKSRHGIYREETLAMLEAQGNVCKICGSDNPNGRTWVIDHDHNCCPSGKSCNKCRRGILCESCNKMLGFAKDKTDVLIKAIEYLDEYERSKRCHHLPN